jgi:putative endonuclease
VARHNITGRTGEDLAAEYLKKNGYKILAINFRTKVGEIDIVAKERSQIVFVEVKTRSSHIFGTPAEAITPKKLHSLIQAGEYYLLKYKGLRNYRIDAIEVLMTDGKANISHIKNITF